MSQEKKKLENIEEGDEKSQGVKIEVEVEEVDIPDSEILEGRSILSVLLQSKKYVNQECQYCKKKSLNYYGTYPERVTAKDYERLMERGMIRDGTEFYAANPWQSCCKFYNPRTNCLNFKISNSQKKALKKWKQFLNGERNLEGKLKNDKSRKNVDKKKESYEISQGAKDEVYRVFDEILFKIVSDIARSRFSSDQISTTSLPSRQYIKQDKKIKGLRVTLIPRLIQVKKQSKQKKKEISLALVSMKEDILDAIKVELDAKSLCGKWQGVEYLSNGQILLRASEDIIETIREEDDLVVHTQVEKKKEEPEKELTEEEIERQKKSEERIRKQEEGRPEAFAPEWDTKEFKPRKFEIRYEESEFTWQKYDLYNRYNKEIHKKKKQSKSFFTYFICKSKIAQEEITSPVDPNEKKSLGTFHMHFYLDDVLIGISSQDHIHSGLTSNYFFYEPVFKDLKLGVISALMEIQEIQKFNIFFPNFKYYYMGTFIHSNSKLKYKASYKPVEFSCPGSQKWVEYTKEVEEIMEKAEQIEISGETRNPEGEFEGDLLGYLAEVKSINKLYIDLEKFSNIKEVLDLQDNIWYKQRRFCSLTTTPSLFYFIAVGSLYFYRYVGRDLVRDSVLVFK